MSVNGLFSTTVATAFIIKQSSVAKFVSNQEAYVPIEWPTVIEGGIPILGGLYATALGYNGIRSSKSMSSARSQKYQGLFRWLGPIVVLFGIFTAWQTHLHLAHPSADQVAQQIAERLSFPVKVDDTTKLAGVQGKGDDIIYDYSVAKSLAELGGRERVRGTLEQYWLSTGANRRTSKRFSAAATQCRCATRSRNLRTKP